MSDPIQLHPGRREPQLATSAGGPHDPSVEARLAKLEGSFEALRAELAAMRADTSYIRGKIEGLPSSWQMITTVLGGNIALAGLLFAVAKMIAH